VHGRRLGKTREDVLNRTSKSVSCDLILNRSVRPPSVSVAVYYIRAQRSVTTACLKKTVPTYLLLCVGQILISNFPR